MRVATRFFSVLLTPLIAVLPLAAQTPADAVAPAPSQTAALRIKIVARDAATVPPGSRARKGYTVEVTDASGKPVSGAAVVCRLPDADPTGTFAKASHSAVLFTGANGQAHFSGIRWGADAGTVVLRVTANKGNAHAGILIEQTLAPAAAAVAAPAVSITPNPNRKRLLPLREQAATVTPPALPAIAQPQVSVAKPPAGVKIRHSSKKKWIILALVAVGAAAAVGLAARGKSSSNSSSAPAQISIGSPTISVGQPQ